MIIYLVGISFYSCSFLKYTYPLLGCLENLSVLQISQYSLCKGFRQLIFTTTVRKGVRSSLHAEKKCNHNLVKGEIQNTHQDFFYWHICVQSSANVDEGFKSKADHNSFETMFKYLIRSFFLSCFLFILINSYFCYCRNKSNLILTGKKTEINLPFFASSYSKYVRSQSFNQYWVPLSNLSKLNLPSCLSLQFTLGMLFTMIFINKISELS